MVMLDADAVINNSSQKVGGSGPRKTHGIYAPEYDYKHGSLEATSRIGQTRQCGYRTSPSESDSRINNYTQWVLGYVLP